MLLKNYAEFTINVPHDMDFMLKRLKNRSLSWKSWRNYFAAYDNKIDFHFSKSGKYIVLYPVCNNRNSLRGQFLLEFEPLSEGGTSINVTVKPPNFTLFFIIWFGGTAAFTISFLLNKVWHGAAIGIIMIIFAAILIYFMHKSALNELDDTIEAFRNFISDAYIREDL